jgi:hypothetical protein
MARSVKQSFAKLVAAARRSDVPERLQLFGDFPRSTADDALDVDWLHVIEIAKVDVLESMRMTAPEDETHGRRKLRRNLAIIVAACQEWEKRI